MVNIHLLRNQLTPRSRVLSEKLKCLTLVNKLPAFYGPRRFITAFKRPHKLSLSGATLIQSMPPHTTSWRSVLILSSHLLLDITRGFFPTKTLYAPFLSPIRATCPVNMSLLDLITRIIFGEEYKWSSSPLCSLLHSPATSSILGPNTFLSMTHPQAEDRGTTSRYGG